MYVIVKWFYLINNIANVKRNGRNVNQENEIQLKIWDELNDIYYLILRSYYTSIHLLLCLTLSTKLQKQDFILIISSIFNICLDTIF